MLNRPSVLSLRNMIFGVEDSLVSTVGLLAGITIAGISRQTILLTGIILIFVEALSMGAGSFLSEYSVEEYARQGRVSARKSIGGGIIMFFSYFISGFIPLFPYIIFEASLAFWVSIGFSSVALFVLGFLQAKLSNSRSIVSGGRMLMVGGVAIVVGVLVGKIVQ
ncbi:MAG: VIT1/CCC1 transporter family protein [Patescibacteria group bacterium]